MNYSIIRYILGIVLKFEALFLCLPLFVGLIYKEASVKAFFISAVLCLATGILLSYKKPRSNVFYATEGFVSVSFSWILLSLFGALPMWLSGDIPSYVDALFEAISGFTTTGASILSSVEDKTRACLMWRSFTHWIGGMGVLVFILAVFPMNGGHRMYLMKAESPGPSVEKLVPRVKNTAMILYGIYTALTVVEIVLLLIFGMPMFDALCTAFGTAGTGGFGIMNDSFGSYAAPLQIIVTVFMILFGVNFNVYYLILCGKLRQAFRSEEVRTYFAIILITSLVITFNIRDMYDTLQESLLHSFFQVGSIITTTGFSSTDFNLWNQVPKTLLIMLMFVGACAGSTGGGIKVSRLVIGLKTVKKELFTIVHPRGVRKVKMDGRLIEHETLRSVNVFIIAYLFIFIFSVLLVGIDNHDFTTNFTAVAATLNNIGPGLEMVGPMENFGFFSDFSKFVLMFDMLTGRLEIFPMLLLFSPLTWRKA